MPRIGPGERLKMAVAVLASVGEDPALASWVRAFSETNNRYLAAQAEVEAMMRELRLLRLELRKRDAELIHALNLLIAARMLEGKPRWRPLAGLEARPPSLLERRAAAAKIRELERLAARARADPGSAEQTQQAAAGLIAATERFGQALNRVTQASEAQHQAVHVRELIGRQWDDDLKSLRHAAHAVGKPEIACRLPARPPKRRSRARQ